MRQQSFCLRNALFALLLGVWLALLPQTAPHSDIINAILDPRIQASYGGADR